MNFVDPQSSNKVLLWDPGGGSLEEEEERREDE